MAIYPKALLATLALALPLAVPNPAAAQQKFPDKLNNAAKKTRATARSAAAANKNSAAA